MNTRWVACTARPAHEPVLALCCHGAPALALLRAQQEEDTQARAIQVKYPVPGQQTSWHVQLWTSLPGPAAEATGPEGPAPRTGLGRVPSLACPMFAFWNSLRSSSPCTSHRPLDSHTGLQSRFCGILVSSYMSCVTRASGASELRRGCAQDGLTKRKHGKARTLESGWLPDASHNMAEPWGSGQAAWSTDSLRLSAVSRVDLTANGATASFRWRI